MRATCGQRRPRSAPWGPRTFGCTPWTVVACGPPRRPARGALPEPGSEEPQRPRPACCAPPLRRPRRDPEQAAGSRTEARAGRDVRSAETVRAPRAASRQPPAPGSWHREGGHPTSVRIARTRSRVLHSAAPPAGSEEPSFDGRARRGSAEASPGSSRLPPAHGRSQEQVAPVWVRQKRHPAPHRHPRGSTEAELRGADCRPEPSTEADRSTASSTRSPGKPAEARRVACARPLPEGAGRTARRWAHSSWQASRGSPVVASARPLTEGAGRTAPRGLPPAGKPAGERPSSPALDPRPKAPVEPLGVGSLQLASQPGIALVAARPLPEGAGRAAPAWHPSVGRARPRSTVTSPAALSEDSSTTLGDVLEPASRLEVPEAFTANGVGLVFRCAPLQWPIEIDRFGDAPAQLTSRRKLAATAARAVGNTPEGAPPPNRDAAPSNRRDPEGSPRPRRAPPVRRRSEGRSRAVETAFFTRSSPQSHAAHHTSASRHTTHRPGHGPLHERPAIPRRPRRKRRGLRIETGTSREVRLPFDEINPGDPADQPPSALRVSHPLSGFVPPGPRGLVSCHIRP